LSSLVAVQVAGQTLLITAAVAAGLVVTVAVLAEKPLAEGQVLRVNYQFPLEFLTR
jgi:hypothetical protein